jgi:hypothetical protein
LLRWFACTTPGFDTAGWLVFLYWDLGREVVYFFFHETTIVQRVLGSDSAGILLGLC